VNIVMKIKNRIFQSIFNNARLSYSQSGEDLIMASILCHIKNGFYVDIGANNPYIQSNTHYFYRRGWCGINIDALPGSMVKFDKVRKKDINLEKAISDKEEMLQYYMFSSSFYNTFSSIAAEKSKNVSKFIGIKNIQTCKLTDIFDKYIASQIDFMSIDVEENELRVLQSNDWSKYRPKIIILEHHAICLPLIKDNPVYKTMISNGYSLFCNTSTNLFYLENDFMRSRYENNLH
jgi:FkbM family methyltransferase